MDSFQSPFRCNPRRGHQNRAWSSPGAVKTVSIDTASPRSGPSLSLLAPVLCSLPRNDFTGEGVEHTAVVPLTRCRWCHSAHEVVGNASLSQGISSHLKNETWPKIKNDKNKIRLDECGGRDGASENRRDPSLANVWWIHASVSAIGEIEDMGSQDQRRRSYAFRCGEFDGRHVRLRSPGNNGVPVTYRCSTLSAGIALPPLLHCHRDRAGAL